MRIGRIGAAFLVFLLPLRARAQETVDWSNFELAASGPHRWRVATDSSENVYVAGSFHNGSNWDVVVYKYDKNGDPVTSFGGDGIVTFDNASNSDAARDLTVDGSGNVFVVGQTGNYASGSFSTSQAFILKLDSSGTPDQSFNTTGLVTHDVAGTNLDAAEAVKVDSSGNVYVAGWTEANGRDVLVLKYDSQGVGVSGFGTSGESLYPGSGTTFETGSGIAVDSTGVYVVGSSGTASIQDVLLLKLDLTTGAPVSSGFGTSGVATYDGGNTEEGVDCVVDSGQNVYVVGKSTDGAGDIDAILVKFTSGGTVDTANFGTSGVATYDSTSGNARALAVALQSDGKILVAGAASNGTNDDLLALRYTTLGAADSDFDSDGIYIATNSGGNDEGQGIAFGASFYVAASWNGGTHLRVTRFGVASSSSGSGGEEEEKCGIACCGMIGLEFSPVLLLVLFGWWRRRRKKARNVT